MWWLAIAACGTPWTPAFTPPDPQGTFVGGVLVGPGQVQAGGELWEWQRERWTRTQTGLAAAEPTAGLLAGGWWIDRHRPSADRFGPRLCGNSRPPPPPPPEIGRGGDRTTVNVAESRLWVAGDEDVLWVAVRRGETLWVNHWTPEGWRWPPVWAAPSRAPSALRIEAGRPVVYAQTSLGIEMQLGATLGPAPEKEQKKRKKKAASPRALPPGCALDPERVTWAAGGIVSSPMSVCLEIDHEPRQVPAPWVGAVFALHGALPVAAAAVDGELRMTWWSGDGWVLPGVAIATQAAAPIIASDGQVLCLAWLDRPDTDAPQILTSCSP